MVCVLTLGGAGEEDVADVRSPIREVPRTRGRLAEGWSQRQGQKQGECLGGGWCGVAYTHILIYMRTVC